MNCVLNVISAQVTKSITEEDKKNRTDTKKHANSK